MNRIILPDHRLNKLVSTNHLLSDTPLLGSQIQPSSIDLRLGVRAWRLRAGFLPMNRDVEDCLDSRNVMHQINLDENGCVFETGCVYLVELDESLSLDENLSGMCNPKSSTGRIDVFVRVIGNKFSSFDQIPAGYDGPLYAEISPRTFSILAKKGERLTQLRISQLLDEKIDHPKQMTCHIDLKGTDSKIIGYRARRHSGVIECDKVGVLDPTEFWEPIHSTGGRIILDPGEFYILVSNEAVKVEKLEAAEMAPIAPELGEFRAHYAGFFDPGFGVKIAARAVLEIRAHDVPFILEHGQPVAKLLYHPLESAPSRIYGEQQNHYTGQGLKLSKHFAI